MISLEKMSKRLFIHVSLSLVVMAMVLFIDLILLFNKALSAFLVISLPLGVAILLFNLTLTGIRTSFKHLCKKSYDFEMPPSYILVTICLKFGMRFCLTPQN